VQVIGQPPVLKANPLSSVQAPYLGGLWIGGIPAHSTSLGRPTLRDTQERTRAELEHHALQMADIRARILVVEDESIVALDLIGTLKRMGHTVVGHALRGEDAIKLAASMQPELVLMDIHLLGKMDGIEAAGWIRANVGTPVIYLSAFGDEATRERAQPTSPAGWLRKPYSKYELEDVIQGALHSVNDPGERH
jgi:two-component system, response regulator PdtaR